MTEEKMIKVRMEMYVDNEIVMDYKQEQMVVTKSLDIEAIEKNKLEVSKEELNKDTKINEIGIVAEDIEFMLKNLYEDDEDSFEVLELTDEEKMWTLLTVVHFLMREMLFICLK